jgi:hypothetical protein
MSAISGIIEVSNTHQKTHPNLNLGWFSGNNKDSISINGGKVSEVITTKDQGIHVEGDKLKEDYWEKRDTTKGITRFMNVTVVFESFDDANKAWPDKLAGIFELSEGVLLHFSGKLSSKHNSYRELKSIS